MDFIYLTQVVQGLCITAEAEHYRRLLSEEDAYTRGTLYWQLVRMTDCQEGLVAILRSRVPLSKGMKGLHGYKCMGVCDLNSSCGIPLLRDCNVIPLRPIAVRFAAS